jgi:hypothetical protein
MARRRNGPAHTIVDGAVPVKEIIASESLPNIEEFWHLTGMSKTKKNVAAVALGRLGGLKGGKARARKLTAEQRRASARKAAVARWSRKKP